MTRNRIVRNILISRQPKDEYVKYVMKCVSQSLKKRHGQVATLAVRQGDDIQTRWHINDRVIEVTLGSDILASLETEPFALDDVFIQALELNDVKIDSVLE
ncbi:hypothetical protein [Exiguobacterium algae]|uniref:hypothetical protein n=1 Tax=Exiguobacterium algae TaxID=2751250 RepID=UPI001BEC9457|nr:hypothetical protein [Exiguobacterium algae]